MRERLRTIRTQINPHFLRNALNSLVGLRDLSGASARQLIADVADLLRRTTVAADREEHTLRQECAYLEEYCKIQRLRYPENLHTRVTIDPSCDRAIVPTLILLPLVENAVTHGLHSTASATVEIVGSAEGYSLTLVVRNSCPAAIAANSEGRHGSGLQLVRERLSLLYGRAAVLATDRPTPTQFEATVIVPLRTSGPQQGARRGTPCES
jgi:LytS/YehU family sensor histidine kinase